MSEFTRWYLAAFFIAVAAFYSIRIVFFKRRFRQEPVYAGVKSTEQRAGQVFGEPQLEPQAGARLMRSCFLGREPTCGYCSVANPLKGRALVPCDGEVQPFEVMNGRKDQAEIAETAIPLHVVWRRRRGR